MLKVRLQNGNLMYFIFETKYITQQITYTTHTIHHKTYIQ